MEDLRGLSRSVSRINRRHPCPSTPPKVDRDAKGASDTAGLEISIDGPKDAAPDADAGGPAGVVALLWTGRADHPECHVEAVAKLNDVGS